MNFFSTEPDGFRGVCPHLRFRNHTTTATLFLRLSHTCLLVAITAFTTLASPTVGPSTDGQPIEKTMVNLDFNSKPLKEVLTEIEKQTDFLFVTASEKVNRYSNITLPKGRYSVKSALDLILFGTNLKYQQKEKYILVFLEHENVEQLVKEVEEKIIATPVKQDVKEEIKTKALVRGVVRDADGQEPMAGVNIVVKGTTRGTTTDTDGEFSIDAEVNEVLVFTFIGYKTFEMPASGRSVLDVTMEADIQSLQAVEISAGYYNVLDKEKTGSISKIDSKIIQDQPVTNPLQSMQGRMPGVYISQDSGIPGSNFTVKIRGQNSLTSGNDPLYIIDGIPFISKAITPNYNAIGSLYGNKIDREDFGSGTSPLNSINPNDIESITVLKDADATAIYGSRGANGVVLITTKKGKTGAVKVDVNLKTGVSKVIRRVQMLNTKQYLAMRMEAVQNDGNETPGAFEYDINGTWDQDRYTDWQDVLIGGSAQMTDVNTSVSAGSMDTRFLFSAGYNDQGTVFPGDDKVRRFSTLFSVSNTSPDKKITSSFTTSYTLNSNNIVSRDLTKLALYLAPNAPAVYDENGKLNWENSTWLNPLAYLENRYADKTFNLLSNAQLGYEIMKGLSIKSSFGFSDIRNTLRQTNLSTSFRPVENLTAADSRLNMASGSTQSWIIEPQLNWDTKVSKGRLSILAGGSYQFRAAESTAQAFRGFSSNALVNHPSSASFKEDFYAGDSKYKYAALYARVNYNWDEKYILNLTGRRDGSSRFGPGKKFANFGALGLAWIFSNEDFVKNNVPILSFGKIRGSYGQTGNDQVGDYRYLDTYAYQSQYQGIADLGPSKLYNPDFSWEVNEKLEGALELGFLSDRILLATAYFLNRSSSQLIDYQLAATTGFPGVTQNSPATVQNTGLELELTTVNVNKGEWKWTTSANISFPRNKLMAFPNLESSSYATTYVIGRSLNIWRAWHYQGVDPSTGLYEAQDINEDGQLTDVDRIHVYEYKQNYYGGLNNSVSWKGLQLDIFFQFASQSGRLPTYGGYAGRLDIYGNGNTSFYQLGTNIFDDRWQQPGDHATTQRFSRGLETGYGEVQFTRSNAVAGDWYYIRLKNISISYQVPEKILKGVKCRVYVQGQNLFTITDYPGLDPETGGTRLPPLATLLGGLQLTF